MSTEDVKFTMLVDTREFALALKEVLVEMDRTGFDDNYNTHTARPETD